MDISYHSSFPKTTSATPTVVNPTRSYTGNILLFAIITIRSYVPLLLHTFMNSTKSLSPIEAPRNSLPTQSVWAQTVVALGMWVVRDS